MVRTGATVGWAFRGFNPHHRKDPSYYPLLAHVAQTGHILRVKNRPGNVHDSKQAVAFLREVIAGLRTAFGRRLPLEFRMDAAFCQRAVFRLLAARGCAYAIKVGYWSWLPLKQLAAEREHWLPVAPNVTGFFHDLHIPQWDLHLRVMIYRKHVAHESPKNFQLDLFTPDDGHFEYSAVATNLALDLPALYAFICGRGAQEKTIAELKGEFALDVIPTHHYGANSAWQQLSILAHNLIRSFQLDTIADAQTPLPQTHLYVPDPEHAHPALPARHAGRPAGPHRRPPRPAPLPQPRHRGPLCVHRRPLGRLSYFRIGANSVTARSAATASVAVSESTKSPAEGSVIHRGILRSTPSGPRTVIGISARRPTRTTWSSVPASGWNR